MSAYVGVDLSTFFVDLVKLDEDTDRAEWVRVPLGGDNAVDRARSYRYRIDEFTWPRWCATTKPHSEWWDDVILCALEDPAGRGDTRKIARVQGVVLATIPARVHCWVLQPAEWRKACGLPGNCSKETVQEWVSRTMHPHADGLLYPSGWVADAYDAYAVAYAARAINQTQEEAA